MAGKGNADHCFSCNSLNLSHVSPQHFLVNSYFENDDRYIEAKLMERKRKLLYGHLFECIFPLKIYFSVEVARIHNILYNYILK